MAIPVVELSRVTVMYRDLLALEDVNLRVMAGEFLALIGPNGSGKTTLVRTALGLVDPTAGAVHLFGKVPRELSREWGRIGYVPQIVQLDPQFPIRVLDVALMGRYGQVGLVRRPGPRDREAAWRALERVGLADMAARQIGRLSGGQRQRMLVARALATEPELLILDEPTTSVDVGTSEGLFELLDGFHRDGMTVIVVSHDVGVVAQHVSQVACLNRRLVAHGRPAEVLQSEVVECMYGPSAALMGHGDLPHVVVRRHPPGEG
jgi:ABC-type Mn2+/Zn2+ transport system ATPase subunit